MYQPKLCIGIGLHSHFFTLRMSHPVYIPGEGQYGNAVVNGVYQGTVAEGWHHVVNLSQSADDAVEKAKDYALEMGIPLVSVSAAELGTKLDEIKRANAEELERRAQEEYANELYYAGVREAKEAMERQSVEHGFIPFGRNAGRRIASIEFGYAQWLLAKREELTGSMRLVADYVAEKLPALHAWACNGQYLESKVRRPKLRVQVQKAVRFEGDYGPKYLMVMVARSGERLIQWCSGAKWAEEGDVCDIVFTIKDFKLNKRDGVAETTIQRVKVEEREAFEDMVIEEPVEVTQSPDSARALVAGAAYLLKEILPCCYGQAAETAERVEMAHKDMIGAVKGENVDARVGCSWPALLLDIAPYDAYAARWMLEQAAKIWRRLPAED